MIILEKIHQHLTSTRAEHTLKNRKKLLFSELTIYFQ